MSTASMEVTMDLPTPPLPEQTPMTCLTEDRGLGFSSMLSRLCFAREEQLAEQVEQSWVQF